jgi:hypothetical protein
MANLGRRTGLEIDRLGKDGNAAGAAHGVGAQLSELVVTFGLLLEIAQV